MGYDRNIVVAQIRTWIGANQGDSTHKTIIDTYNAHKPLPAGYTVKYTDAWCATTVSAAAIAVGYGDIYPLECSCNRMITKAKNMGIWVESDDYIPAPGDLILYDWQDSGSGDCTGNSEHVGMVECINGNVITVIEGNKSKKCDRRQILVNGRYIRGYVTPKFTEAVQPVVQTPAKVTSLKKGGLGIDTSKWQGSKVDYKKAVEKGYDFAILRIGVNGTKDATFDKDFASAKAAGMKVGVYYAVNSKVPAISNETAIEWAKQTVQWLNGASLDLPIAFDIEGGPYNVASRKAANTLLYYAFADIVKAAGYKCMLYTGEALYNYAFDKASMKDPLWIAKYSQNGPNVGREVAIWQYTSGADSSDFYTDKLDRNKIMSQPSTWVESTSTPVQPVQTTTEKIKKLAQAEKFDPNVAGSYTTTGNLNMRFGPDSDKYDRICVVPKGEKVRNYGYYTEVDGVKWYYVVYGNNKGFCSGKWLKK